MVKADDTRVQKGNARILKLDGEHEESLDGAQKAIVDSEN